MQVVGIPSTTIFPAPIRFSNLSTRAEGQEENTRFELTDGNGYVAVCDEFDRDRPLIAELIGDVSMALIPEAGTDGRFLSRHTAKLRPPSELTSIALLDDKGEIDTRTRWNFLLGDDVGSAGFIDLPPAGLYTIPREVLYAEDGIRAIVHPGDTYHIYADDLVVISPGVVGWRPKDRSPGTSLRIACDLEAYQRFLRRSVLPKQSLDLKVSLVDKFSHAIVRESHLEPVGNVAATEFEGIDLGSYVLQWDWRSIGRSPDTVAHISDFVNTHYHHVDLLVDPPGISVKSGVVLERPRAQALPLAAVGFPGDPYVHLSEDGRFTSLVTDSLPTAGDAWVGTSVGKRVRDAIDVIQYKGGVGIKVRDGVIGTIRFRVVHDAGTEQRYNISVWDLEDASSSSRSVDFLAAENSTAVPSGRIVSIPWLRTRRALVCVWRDGSAGSLKDVGALTIMDPALGHVLDIEYSAQAGAARHDRVQGMTDVTIQFQSGAHGLINIPIGRRIAADRSVHFRCPRDISTVILNSPGCVNVVESIAFD